MKRKTSLTTSQNHNPQHDDFTSNHMKSNTTSTSDYNYYNNNNVNNPVVWRKSNAVLLATLGKLHKHF